MKLVKEFRVVVVTDEEHGWMKFEFPDTDLGFEAACLKLAKFARGIDSDGNELSTLSLMNLFCGHGSEHLYETRKCVKSPMKFVFRMTETSHDKVIVTLKTEAKEERIEIVIKDDE